MNPPTDDRTTQGEAAPGFTDAFQPTWRRGLLAAVVAGLAFLLPQEEPLAYYSPDDPSPGRLYLAITCEGNVSGLIQVYYDTGDGFNKRESFRWMMAPSARPYTYTFPLPDAPLLGLRFDPYQEPGELTVAGFRILNRRGELVRQFSPADFASESGLHVVGLATGGWKLVSPPGATGPRARVVLSTPLIPEGMNQRNWRHCLLAWGYLGLMLWILLMAFYFTFLRPNHWRKIAPTIVFLAGIALLFSAVGQRGLIKDSWRYAHFQPSTTPAASPDRP